MESGFMYMYLSCFGVGSFLMVLLMVYNCSVALDMDAYVEEWDKNKKSAHRKLKQFFPPKGEGCKT